MAPNPFGVQSPEHVDAEYIARNFVDMFTDFPRLKDPSNTFIHGARGTGKSILLRSLEPEVLRKKHEISSLLDLPYFAVHVPLRKAEFAVPELSRLAGYAGLAVGEHLLVMQVTFRIAEALSSLETELGEHAGQRFQDAFERLIRLSGAIDLPTAQNQHPLLWVKRCCEEEIMRVRQFFTRLPFASNSPYYVGALTGFLDFLIPLAREIQEFSGVAKVPLFIMLDDADNLPVDMQRVLNSWVSARSTKEICLKISTQLGYATLRTVDNRVIESPHDFAEVNLTSVYSTSDDVYAKRVREIVTRRLQLAGIDSDVDQFFPEDIRQSARVREIQQEIDEEHRRRQESGDTSGATRPRDEVGRYAVPTLMRELAGMSKSSHTYSYSGFKSLVDLSSGVVRWFLEPASRMFDRMEGASQGTPKSIPVKIQDEVIFDWSREFIQRLSARGADVPPDDEKDADADNSLHAGGHETELYESLRNLVDSLGRLFRHKILNDNSSEQRAISIVLRGKPSAKLQSVLDLGIRLGYFQKTDNAAKEADGGRMPRYILARRLGPYFRLDISGYASHPSVTATMLELAMKDPTRFVRARTRENADGQQIEMTLEQSGDD